MRILDCQYGEHYFKKREKGSKTLRLQSSRKIGCQAKIRMKCYTTYPDHALPDTTNMTSRQAKQTQKNALDKLRKALESGEKVNMDTKSFVSLPSIDAHSGHPLGCDACGFAQRIHPLVTQKITELVSNRHRGSKTPPTFLCNQNSQQSCKQPQDGLPEKQVTNSS